MIAARWIFVLAPLAFGAAILGGCSETMPLAQLPDITKLPQKVLSKDEQQGKVNEMIEKSQRQDRKSTRLNSSH